MGRGSDIMTDRAPPFWCAEYLSQGATLSSPCTAQCDHCIRLSPVRPPIGREQGLELARAAALRNGIYPAGMTMPTPQRYRIRYEHPAPIAAHPHTLYWYVYTPQGERIYNRTHLFGGWHNLAAAIAFAEAWARNG